MTDKVHRLTGRLLGKQKLQNIPVRNAVKCEIRRLRPCGPRSLELDYSRLLHRPNNELTAFCQKTGQF